MSVARVLWGLIIALGAGCVGLAQVSVVATTSIVGSVVQAVGGERITLTVLFPPGTDPHTFEPTPRDLLALTRARLIFVNGLGLEERLLDLLAAAEFSAKVVTVSDGVEVLAADHGQGGDPGESVDPHVWLDPLRVLVWVDNVERALGRADPGGAVYFAHRAQEFRARLQALHQEVLTLVGGLPPERKILVTDHWAFGYFAERYGFVPAAALVSSFSSLAEPSPRELVEVQEKIRSFGVPAIFVAPTFNPALAQAVAREAGVRLVILAYEGLLPGQDYFDWFRGLVVQIVEALSG